MICQLPTVCPTSIHFNNIPDSSIYFYDWWNGNVPPYQPDYGIDFSYTFHIFGIDWEKNHIDFYIDNILRCSISELQHCPSQTCYNSTTLQCSCLLPPQLLISSLVPQTVVINGNVQDSTSYNQTPPSTTGDICELDYFHYYRRNPIVEITGFSGDTITVQVKPYLVNPGVFNSFGYTINNNNNAQNYKHLYGDTLETYQFIVEGQDTIQFHEQNASGSGDGVEELAVATCNTSLEVNKPVNSVYLCDSVSSGVYITNNVYAAGNYCSSHTAEIHSSKNVECWTKNGAIFGPGFQVQVGGSLKVNVIQ